MEWSSLWKKILWTVDPFAQDTSLQISAALAAKILTKGSPIEIQPTYLLNQFPSGVFTTISNEEFIERITSLSNKRVHKITKSLRIENMLPIKIIIQPLRTQKTIAETLLNYAKEINSDLIVASTHARRGIERWFAGSFVENLMFYSDIPLFIVNPRWKSIRGFKHILFPTDFSTESQISFEKVVDLSRVIGSKITIFHQIPYFINPHLQSAFSAYPIYEETIEQEMKQKREEADQLMKFASKYGIHTRIYIDYSFINSPAESILAYSKKRNCIIAMTAKSGPVSSVLLGSTTRRVVRGSNYPVWVLHPHLSKKTQSSERKVA